MTTNQVKTSIRDLVLSLTDPITIYVATDDGVWRARDQGTGWLRLPEGLLDDMIVKLVASDSVVLAQGANGIYRLTDCRGEWPSNERQRAEEAASKLSRPYVSDIAAYSPTRVGNRWEYATSETVAGRAATSRKIVAMVESEESIRNKKYYAVSYVTAGDASGSKQVMYSRTDNDGVYSLDPRFVEERELLEVPIPLELGYPWTITGPRTSLQCEAEIADQVQAGGITYSHAIRIKCWGTDEGIEIDRSVFLAKDVGMVKQILNAHGQSVELDLRSHEVH